MNEQTKQKRTATIEELKKSLAQLEIDMERVFRWRPGDPPIELKRHDIEDIDETNDYTL